MITAVEINIVTAVKDLRENLASPHIPCPDVHPEPIAGPSPIRNAPNIIVIKLPSYTTSILFPFIYAKKIGPVAIPIKTTIRQCFLSS